ncbi:CPCC family cysteine-rich protein [Streptomyces sp. NPDC002619]|uniref:CPCC family cysteine-rich protein n=1 Tax=Streptomyces sp. NPDC002619 TaxID=3364655 RepID=UPI0036B5F474
MTVPFVNNHGVPETGTEPCPCCHHMTLTHRGGFEMCQVCGWEDDGQDDHVRTSSVVVPTARRVLPKPAEGSRAIKPAMLGAHLADEPARAIQQRSTATTTTVASCHQARMADRRARQPSATVVPVVRIEGLIVPAACPFRGDTTGNHGYAASCRRRLTSLPSG